MHLNGHNSWVMTLIHFAQFIHVHSPNIPGHKWYHPNTMLAISQMARLSITM